MKSIPKLMILVFFTVVLSSCGAIPTLPPMDSTITIRTPAITIMPLMSTSTSAVVIATEELPALTPRAEATAIQVTKTPYLSPTSPTATSTKTPNPASPTPGNTSTPTPTSTPTATSTFTPTPTYTATPLPYSVQILNPYYLENFARNDLGCKWLGIAGQIFDSRGQVQTDIIIKAGGEINGIPVEEDMTMPLTNPEIDTAYGPGGYEITLGSAPADSDLTAWIQLYNLTGDPLTERIFFVTYNDCQKNLILMNFSEQ